MCIKIHCKSHAQFWFRRTRHCLLLSIRALYNIRINPRKWIYRLKTFYDHLLLVYYMLLWLYNMQPYHIVGFVDYVGAPTNLNMYLSSHVSIWKYNVISLCTSGTRFNFRMGLMASYVHFAVILVIPYDSLFDHLCWLYGSISYLYFIHEGRYGYLLFCFRSNQIVKRLNLPFDTHIKEGFFFFCSLLFFISHRNDELMKPKPNRGEYWITKKTPEHSINSLTR